MISSSSLSTINSISVVMFITTTGIATCSQSKSPRGREGDIFCQVFPFSFFHIYLFFYLFVAFNFLSLLSYVPQYQHSQSHLPFSSFSHYTSGFLTPGLGTLCGPLCIISRPFSTSSMTHKLCFRFRHHPLFIVHPTPPLRSTGGDRFLITLPISSSDWLRQKLLVTPGTDVSLSPWLWLVFIIQRDGLGCVSVSEDQISSWLSFYQCW